MTIETDKKEPEEFKKARESFTGKALTQSQFDESMTIASVMEREIKRSGSFKEKLGDYAHAFSRSEKFDAMKAETILRDQFKSRYGQTMNQMRKKLMERESSFGEEDKKLAMGHALNVGTRIASGETMPFYRAYDHEAVQLSRSLDITEKGARALMTTEFKSHEGKELYAHGKEIEKQYHHPKLEADKQQRQAERGKARSFERSR